MRTKKQETSIKEDDGCIPQEGAGLRVLLGHLSDLKKQVVKADMTARNDPWLDLKMASINFLGIAIDLETRAHLYKAFTLGKLDPRDFLDALERSAADEDTLTETPA